LRLAAIYDIHGNLPALEAVLDELRHIKVDAIVVGGDVVPGPMPRETFEALHHLDVRVRFLLGNGEVAVLEQMAGRAPARVPEANRPIIRWTAEQLEAEFQQEVSRWPETVSLDIPDLGAAVFCHATPRDENEIFTRDTPADVLLPLFEQLDVDLVVCGHTHMQFDRMIAGTRVVNAGSVGMPFGEPGADWLLIDRDIELRHTTYDLAEAADRIRASSYPNALDFADRNVLHPPDADAMLEVFTRAATGSKRASR